MITVLFADRKGPYWNRPGVDAWDEERNALLYRGNGRVLSHFPCQRWGRFARWHGEACTGPPDLEEHLVPPCDCHCHDPPGVSA